MGERDDRDDRDVTGVGGARRPDPGDQVKLAREALAAARAAAQAKGAPHRTSPAGSGHDVGVPGGAGLAVPEPRREPVRRVRRDDPQVLAAAIDGLLEAEGWNREAATGAVFGRWPQIVGPDLAGHTQPESLRDGELTVVADSTAWATQLRLLAAQLVRRLNAELGAGTVRRVRVRGPVSSGRKPGQWRSRDSRGPGDTYG